MADENIAKLASTKIEKISSELKDVTEQLTVLEAKKTNLEELLQSWQKIHAQEKQATDVTGSESGSAANSDSQNAVAQLQAGELDHGNNTDFVRAFIRKSARGVKTLDVRRAVAQAKLAVGKTFVYTAISKLKERGEIEKRGGRYYATSKMHDGAANNMFAQVM